MSKEYAQAAGEVIIRTIVDYSNPSVNDTIANVLIPNKVYFPPFYFTLYVIYVYGQLFRFFRQLPFETFTSFIVHTWKFYVNCD